MIHFARRLKRRLARIVKREQLNSLPPVIYQSRYTNIYHCTVQKTASRWLRSILMDARTYQYSGLHSIDFYQQIYNPTYGIEARPVHERTYTDVIPEGYIISPLYMGYQGYETLKKPRHHRAFFVMRDPRDIVVSWYFSARYSHTPVGPLYEMRQHLEQLDLEDGLCYSIDVCQNEGIFQAMRDWHQRSAGDESVLLLKYEELTAADNVNIFRRLFQHCDINMPFDIVQGLLSDYSFEKMAGHKRGDENIKSHYRKGVAGDWQNYFTDKVMNYYMKLQPTLAEALEY